MEVLGRDPAREAFRVATDTPDGRIVGLLPEHVIGRGLLIGGHGHATAYDWIARHAGEIDLTLKALRSGEGRIPRPFNRMELVED
ncbi:hypothetical protein [Wenxinia marina]|uniref:Uncharacterized protein n=1 Tax=Wenxinia marina DSM 24838 TaxID=1123501 RepID=A0A0D0QFW1_9RHOB|nr:hypothetical protein [Wenxinia marina]KIQ69923.1 hypothetical protein Wenmar_01493 [Wenxinia marina DSM 24838]GGL62211.1 hypothetical protein GCM10011392_15960 [Wenxinia marina]